MADDALDKERHADLGRHQGRLGEARETVHRPVGEIVKDIAQYRAYLERDVTPKDRQEYYQIIDALETERDEALEAQGQAPRGTSRDTEQRQRDDAYAKFMEAKANADDKSADRYFKLADEHNQRYRDYGGSDDFPPPVTEAPAQTPEQQAEAKGTLSVDQIAADIRGEPMYFGGKLIDPKNFSPGNRENLYKAYGDIDNALGDDDPWDVLGEQTAGARMSPEEIAAKNEKLRQEAVERAERLAQQKQENYLKAQAFRQDFLNRQQAAKEQDQAKRTAADEARKQQKAAEDYAKGYQDWIIKGNREKRDQIDFDQGQADRAGKQQADAAAKIEKEQNAFQRLKQRRQQLALQTTQRAGTLISNTSVRLGSLPRPGGIGLLLVAIIVLLFAIVPANPLGLTRLQLLGLALLGDMQLPSHGGVDTVGQLIGGNLAGDLQAVEAALAGFGAGFGGANPFSATSNGALSAAALADMTAFSEMSHTF